ncbi:MAG: ATP-binding protein [Rickettsiales bacterium]|nr:ATP-binding protein [Rickettsiales bacterium]
MFKVFFQDPELDTTTKEFKDFDKIPKFSDLIPYEKILEDNQTIFSRNSTLTKVIELGGFDNLSSSFELIEDLMKERINAFNNLSSDISLNFFTFKNKFHNETVENSKSEILNKINDIRNVDFREVFEISIFVVINKQYSFSKKDLDKHNIELHKALNDFNCDVDRIFSNLGSYSPKILDNTSQSNFALSQFISYILHNRKTPVGAKTHLYRHLATVDVEFNPNDGIITLEDRYCQMLNLNIDLKTSNEDLFKIILALNLEFDICQNIMPIDKMKVMKNIKDREGRNRVLVSGSATSIRDEELAITKELIENDYIKMFSSSFYIKVFSDNKETLLKNVSIIKNKFSNFGVTVITETINCKFAFLSSITGNEDKDKRRIPLTGENLSDFVPLFNTAKGFAKNSFGDFPVAKFKNLANLIYNFNFHRDENKDSLGHTFIIGGTGAGKSTLVAFLLAECLRYENMKILAFDSKKGLKIPVNIFGGNYSDVANPHEVQLNPFSLEENLMNRQFLVEFLSILVGGTDINEQAVLEEVVRQNYDSLVKNNIKGSMAKLQTVFGIKKQLKDRPSLAKRIEKWIEDKDLSGYFNNEQDNLSFEKPINCFDMDGILSNDTILAPISFYIFHKFSELIEQNKSHPKIILIDEFQRFDNSPNFAPKIRVALKQYRKKNTVFIGCIQEPSVILASENIRKDEYLSNIATFIIFPDSKAEKSDYEALGLNENEFNFIKNTTNDNTQRRVLIKQTNGKSSIIDINLASLGKYIKAFSSSGRDLDLFERLQQDGKADYIDKYLAGGGQ